MLFACLFIPTIMFKHVSYVLPQVICFLSDWSKPNSHTAHALCGTTSRCLHSRCQKTCCRLYHLTGKVSSLLTAPKDKIKMHLILPVIMVTIMTLKPSHQKSLIHTADPFYWWTEKYTWKSFLSHMLSFTIDLLFWAINETKMTHNYFCSIIFQVFLSKPRCTL